MNLRTTLIVFLCFCATTVLRAERVDMLKAGAKANGKTLNTKLINSTIDRLNRGGGGTLFFPAGTYLTGSIHLKSNITLELEAGATLLFSDNFDDYLPFVEVRHDDEKFPAFDLCGRCREYYDQRRRNFRRTRKEMVDGVLSCHD